MQNHVIGIDISKSKLDICAIFDGKIRKKIVENSELGFKQLHSWISKNDIKNPHFCMEATGHYSEPVVDFLYNAGCKVSVVNPFPIKAFRISKMIRQKTDCSDSEVISRFCLQNNPKLWKPRTQDSKELHEINSRLDSLKIELNKLKNQSDKSYSNGAVKKGGRKIGSCSFGRSELQKF